MIWDVCSCSVFSRAYYIVVVPLKKQRTGKFLKPWDNPDEMNLEEVRPEMTFYCPSFSIRPKETGEKLVWGGDGGSRG